MKRLLHTLLLFGSLFVSAQAQPKAKVGLALSGGGAKGLAHIGILQAIDSAGLKVEAISGTSMGAVVGSLYAVGYSGKEIEKIARRLDWNALFLSIPKLDEVGFLQKEEYGRYPLQLPLERGKLKPYTGVLEAQGVWRTLAGLYLPVYDVKDFSRFNIPFECVATDLLTGDAVILREGDITTAVRASMAIPSVFSAVDYKNTKLVDGGVVRNFPVENLEDYGVNYFIGVNLSPDMEDVGKLQTPIDVLLQIAFYKDAVNFGDQKRRCQLLIEPELSGFSAASFSASDSIIDIGIATGLKYYPYFKKLADSLNRAEVPPAPILSRLPDFKEVTIDAVEIFGISSVACETLAGKLGLKTGKTYQAKDISEAVDVAFSTLDYRKIGYALEPIRPGHAIIRFEVRENPKSFFNVGLHYTAYSGSALVASLTSQNEMIRRSRTSLKINLSENFRARFKHQQFFTELQRWGVEFSGYFERFKLPIYIDFEERYRYKNRYAQLDLNLFKLLGRSSAFGGGLRREWLNLKPDVSPTEFITAINAFWNLSVFVRTNTLDEPAFPHRGLKLDFSGGLIFNQNPDAAFVTLSQQVQLGDSVRASIGNYPHLNLTLAKYFPLRPRTTLIAQLNSGINFQSRRSFLYFYSVGGLQDFLRNQITFAGLRENQVNTNSIVSTQLGVQFEPYDKLFLTLRANAALYDFAGLKPADWTESNFLSGYSLSAGHRSFLGPIELSLLYNDQSQSFAGYIVVGFSF